ncbi:MAG TPA: hypothetical protein VF125_04415, partial [Solirubrobacterales bacterium]
SLPVREQKGRTMKQKLMLIASGALAALALAALPAVAAAGEFAADCENGAAVCTGTVAGGATQIRNDAGEGLSCASVGGKATVNNGTSTGALELAYKGCKENITGFGLSCNNTGVPGEIKTGATVTHLIYLEHNATTSGLKVTLPGHGTGSGGWTLSCAGFFKKTMTGSFIGHISNPNCGTFQASYAVDFVESSVGVQWWMQATTTGETADLMSSNDAGGAYTTTAITGSTTITWEGTNVKLTC